MQVVIVGAGGHGKVVLDILRREGKLSPVGFIDADTALAGKSVGGLPVLGAIHLLPKLREKKIRGAIVAIGDNRVRCSYAGMVLEAGLELISTVHPAAVIADSARIGKNSVVAAGAVIGVECAVGDSVIINTGAVVDHECQIARGVHVGPGVRLAGRVRVAEQTLLGIGTVVIPCISIGEQATVGAGSVVLEDIPDYATAYGVPARVIRIEEARAAQ